MKYWLVFAHSQGEILVYGSKYQVLRYMYFRFNLVENDIDSITEINKECAEKYTNNNHYFCHNASNY